MTKLDENYVNAVLAKDSIDKEDFLTMVREVQRLESLQANPMSEKAYKTFESRGLHGQESKIERIKEKAALLFDAFDDVSVPPGNTEAGRLIATAKTQLESAVMFGVKAVSRYE